MSNSLTPQRQHFLTKSPHELASCSLIQTANSIAILLLMLNVICWTRDVKYQYGFISGYKEEFKWTLKRRCQRLKRGSSKWILKDWVWPSYWGPCCQVSWLSLFKVQTRNTHKCKTVWSQPCGSYYMEPTYYYWLYNFLFCCPTSTVISLSMSNCGCL